MESIIYPVMSILLAINVFFVRRLVMRIESIDATVTSRLPVQQNEIKNMANEIESLKNEIRQLSHDIKDFSRIRERVSVIEALMSKKKNASKLR